MIDIKLLRTDPDIVRENIKKKFQDDKLPLVDEVIALDKDYRECKTRAEYLRSQRNKISKQIGFFMSQGKKDEAEAAKAEVKAMQDELESLSAKEEELSCGPLSLSIPRHEVRWGGAEIDLTSREFSLLQTLLENKNVVLSRDSLLEKVWGYDYMGETNVVDVYVRYLRNKIAAAGGENVIQTVRGVGYVIREDHE